MNIFFDSVIFGPAKMNSPQFKQTLDLLEEDINKTIMGTDVLENTATISNIIGEVASTTSIHRGVLDNIKNNASNYIVAVNDKITTISKDTAGSFDAVYSSVVKNTVASINKSSPDTISGHSLFSTIVYPPTEYEINSIILKSSSDNTIIQNKVVCCDKKVIPIRQSGVHTTRASIISSIMSRPTHGGRRVIRNKPLNKNGLFEGAPYFPSRIKLNKFI